MKKIIYGLLTGVLILAVASCSFERPEKIGIKTKAKYKFTIAELEKDLSDISPVEKILSSDDSDAVADLYLYEPVKTDDASKNEVQTLIMSKTLAELPVDMSSYLNEGMLSQIAEIDINKSFSIDQDLSQSVKQEIDVSKLNDMINSGFVIGGAGGGDIIINFDDNNGFTSIDYAEGYLDVRPIPGFEGIGSGTISIKEDGNVVTSGEFVNDEVSLPLNGVSLKSKGMSIEFSGAPIGYIGRIREGSKIKTVKGLTLSSTISSQINPISINFDIPAAEGSGFESVTIGKGEIKTKLNSEGWTPGVFDYSISFTGGLNLNISGDDKTDSVKPLDDVTYENKIITAEINLNLNLNNCDIDFSKNPEFVFDMGITKIDSATIALPDSFDTTFDQYFNLPEEAQAIVKSVKWGASGIKITSSNTLPTGNTIGLTIKSDYLMIPETTQTITCGNMDEKLEFMSSTAEFNHASSDPIDLKASFTMPGWNAENKTITIKNVELNREYNLSLKVEPVLNWKEIEISSSFINISDTMNTGINANSMVNSLLTSVDSSLQNSLGLKECDIFLFCDIPEISGLSDASFNGTVKASIGKEDESNNFIENSSAEPVYFLGNKDGPTDLPVKKAPVLEFSPTKEKTVITDVEAAYGEKGIDISPIINAETADDETMFIDYNISFRSGNSDTIKITPEVFNNTDVKNVKVSVIVILPITIKATKDVNLDVMKLVKPDWDSDPTADLLGRDPSDSGENSSLDMVLELINKVAVEYKLKELPFITEGDVRFVIDMDGDGDKFEPQELNLENGTLALNPEDVMKTNPLRPSVYLVLPENSNISLKDTMKVAANLKLEIQSSGKIVSLPDITGGDE